MSTPMKITLRIHIACGCDECLTKVQSSLLKVGAILQQDVAKGLFTISTFKPQERVESILRSRLNTRFDIVSTEEINGPDPGQGTTINGNWSVNIGAHGCGSVEVTQSTTIRSNMTQSSHRRDKQAAGETSEPPPNSFAEPQPPAGAYGYAPAPSAPLMPESEYGKDYGWRDEPPTARMNDQGSFFIAFMYIVMFMMIYICLNLDGKRA